jgi:hypothetical protein
MCHIQTACECFGLYNGTSPLCKNGIRSSYRITGNEVKINIGVLLPNIVTDTQSRYDSCSGYLILYLNQNAGYLEYVFHVVAMISSITLTHAGKGKGQVYPITGHEGTEGE